MTPREAGIYLKLHPVKVAQYCREGKIQATSTPKGQHHRTWEIAEEAVQAFARSRTTHSQRATAQWAKRRNAGFMMSDRDNTILPTQDDVDRHEQRLRALNGHVVTREMLGHTAHLSLWWNRENGAIVG